MIVGNSPPALREEELDELERRIDDWARRQLAELDVVAAVDRNEPGDDRRWYVRLRGEEKSTFTVWLTLRQRTLEYETYVLPAPPQRAAEVHEWVLRRNHELAGAAFTIGAEDALYLRGHLALASVTDAELDRILGSLYAWTERYFPTLLTLAGFRT